MKSFGQSQKKVLSEERRIEEDRARLAAIVESSEDAIIGKTLQGVITSWNAGAERLFGYTAAEMVGESILQLIPSDRLEEEAEILRMLQLGERVMHFETVRRHRDGHLLDISLSTSPIRDANGQIIGASKIARDVSRRKQAEAAVEKANELLREQTAVLDLAPVFVRDLNNRIILWTQGAERLYGFSKKEVLGCNSHELFQTTFPESLGVFEEQLRRTGRWEGELLHRKRDGQRLVVASQQIIYRNGSGKPLRILETNTDITERRRIESELNQSQEELRALAARLLRVREEEAMRIARELHDELGRSLTMMKLDIGAIEDALLTDEADPQKVQHLQNRLGGIREAIDETVRTVRKISAELRPGLLDDLGLAAAIEWHAQDFQKRSGQKCILTLPEEDLEIKREQATALFRIYQECLTNVARHAHATKVWVNLSAEDGEIVLEIEDNGVGISSAQMEGGRSLGLVGMRERAAAFDGLVEIAGAVGQGTTVIVRMPISAAEG